MKFLAAILLSSLFVFGCADVEDERAPGSSAGATGTAGSGGSGGTAGVGPVVASGPAHKVQFGPVTVASGKENTQCVVLRLGNVGKAHIGSIHNELGDSSHHLIVYRVSDTEEITTPFDCEPFTDTFDPTKGSTLMISQKKDDLLQLPAGVGYTLDDNQMLRLEMHYINTTPNEQTLVATSTLTELSDAEFKDEADFLFIGSPDFKIPPHQKHSLGPTPLKLPDEHVGANLFAMTGHEHHHGTNVTVHLSANEEDPGTPLYDVPNWQWSEPATVQFNPTVQLPEGGGFTFTCEWNNTSDKVAKFGESANDEMCFFWAYYYPSKGTGSKVCVHSEQLKVVGKTDLCCPGDPLCDLLNQ
jgi:hypothetical protein